jgi:hypothetical protein
MRKNTIFFFKRRVKAREIYKLEAFEAVTEPRLRFLRRLLNKNIDKTSFSKLLFSSSCGLSWEQMLFLAAFPAATVFIAAMLDIKLVIKELKKHWKVINRTGFKTTNHTT